MQVKRMRIGAAKKGACSVGFPVLTGVLLLMVFSVSNCLAVSRQYEVVVHSGVVKDTIAYLKDKNFWGPKLHDEQLAVPRLVVAVSSEKWSEESGKIPVAEKKELFYRALVPMILIENEMILESRNDLLEMERKISENQALNAEEQKRLAGYQEKYGLQDIESQDALLKNLLHRIDIIPPALALGQGAYESGYGTSRFAVEGNALFGQWTYGGKGMKPKEHRASKGDYGVASYRWPFDSVRSYMLNLNTHNAYKELRDKRAEIRQQGKKPTGLDLVSTLSSYSEKGDEYVKTLKSIIIHNNLSVADEAKLRDEPFTLVVGVGSKEQAAGAESKIEELRRYGELDRIVKSMHLEGGK